MTVYKKLKAVETWSIKLDKSYQLLEHYTQAHNARASKASERIKAVHRALAEKIIRLYRRRWLQYQAENLWANPGDLPYLELNNQFLAKIMSCTDRTIRNYRDRLEALGLIVETIWHGSNAAYEIKIDPKFLWIESNLHRGMRKIFPHTSTCTPLQEPFTRTLLPEKSGNDMAPVPGTDSEQEPFYRNEQGSTTKKEESQEPQEQTAVVKAEKLEHPPAKGAGDPPCGDGPPANDPGEEPKSPRRQFAEAFWSYAKNTLWPGKYFSEPEKEKILARIGALFGAKHPHLYGKILKAYAFRIHLVKLYWQKDCGPLPSPAEFFDYTNQEGFVKTKAWARNPEKYSEDPTRKLQTISRLVGRQRPRGSGMTNIADLFK